MAGSVASFSVGLACLVALMAAVASATQFRVGGSRGWSVPDANAEPYNSWAGRMRFQIGDQLLFVYPKETDAVVVVDQAAYNACNTSAAVAGGGRFDDGSTVFTFDRSGPFFFISGNESSCRAGEKLIVFVMADPHHTPPPPPTPTPMPMPSPVAPPSLAPSPSPATSSPTPSISPMAPSPATSSPTPSISPMVPSPATSPGPSISPMAPSPATLSPGPAPTTTPGSPPAPANAAPSPGGGGGVSQPPPASGSPPSGGEGANSTTPASSDAAAAPAMAGGVVAVTTLGAYIGYTLLAI